MGAPWPHDDGQNDDDEGETTGSTAGLPASAGPARMLRTCRPTASPAAALGACASESTKTI